MQNIHLLFTVEKMITLKTKEADKGTLFNEEERHIKN